MKLYVAEKNEFNTKKIKNQTLCILGKYIKFTETAALTRKQ